MVMASNLRPEYGYTVVYVKDVARSMAFYEKAFGFRVRRLDESHRWGELESGQATVAFTPLHQHETDDLTGTVQTQESGRDRASIEVCFVYSDVDAAYKKAVENGAVPVSEPEEKEWAQKVGYVRDLNGIVVRMGSYVRPPKHDRIRLLNKTFFYLLYKLNNVFPQAAPSVVPELHVIVKCFPFDAVVLSSK